MTNREASTLTFDDQQAFLVLCGLHDENLRRLEERLGVAILVRGNQVTLEGEPSGVRTAKDLLRQLYGIARKSGDIGPAEIDRGIAVLTSAPGTSLAEVMRHGIKVGNGGGVVSPRTPNQREYIRAMETHDVVVVVGPAGTGKTYLAMAAALAALHARKVKRLVLTRPAVEAGERLGFLPGDIVEKVNPYLRPLYDALHDLCGVDRGNRLVERGVIEIAPLAFMRGRTLSDSFVILDEAQNCSIDQMKMLLTRLGYNSRAVVTGDVTQSDLPPDRPSGLEHALGILSGVPGIAFCRLQAQDVMRHPIVGDIVRAYSENGSNGKRDPG